MRDVRTVFTGLFILAAASVVVLVLASRRADRAATWRAIRRGAIGLAVAIVVARGSSPWSPSTRCSSRSTRCFFPAGSYDFDPATERLVQLFPFQFWQETAIVVGVVIVAGCAVVAAIAGPRARRALERAATPRALAAAHGMNP